MSKQSKHSSNPTAGRTPAVVPALGLGGLCAAGLAVAIAMSPAASTGSGTSPGTGPVTDLRAAPMALVKPSSCDALLTAYREAAVDQLDRLGQVMPMAMPGLEGASQARTAADSSGSGAADSANVTAQGATTSGTGTNVQVAGVDEADIAKRSGDLLFSVQQTPRPTLTAIRLGSGSVAPQRIGSLRLPENPTSMLLDGKTALVISAVGGPMAYDSMNSSSRIAGMFSSSTRLDQVDLADPSNPRLVSSMTLESSSVAGARVVDGVAHLAVNSTPDIDLPAPKFSAKGEYLEKETKKAYREAIEATPLSRFLPKVTASSPDGSTRTADLLPCTDIAVPATPSGAGTLTLLSVDVAALDASGDRLAADGSTHREATGVLATGGTVYADADTAVVGLTDWGTGPSGASQGASTTLHTFTREAAGGGFGLGYAASGEVPGRLLNQFSMDVDGGYLRVATTSDPVVRTDPVPGVAPDASAPAVVRKSQSQVIVLKPDGRVLEQVGSVGGLGKDEQIYAVRFIGDRGYVVTFRQVDPLYVLDLSDPARPHVGGELKIPGYSAYLHPAGEHRLIGVGQDADVKTGRTQGLQLSLFDVSDPAAPQRLSSVAKPAWYSEAEYDHHAFSMSGDTVLVPFNSGSDAAAGLARYGLDGNALSGPRTLDDGGVARRSLIDPDRIIVLSDTAVTVYDRATSAKVGSDSLG